MIRRRFRWAALVTLAPLAAAVAGCAAGPTEGPTTASYGRQCIFARNIDSFRAVDSDTVNLRVGVNDIYQVKLFSPCTQVRYAERVALQTRGGSSTVCSALDADLIVPSPTGPERCALTSFRKLTPTELAALPPRERP